MSKLAIALGFLVLNLYTYHWMASHAVIPSRQAFSTFPMALGEWICQEKVVLDAGIERNLGAADYLICDFRRTSPHDLVGVYVGYHDTQIRKEGGGSGENSIHPPAHCLPGSGWDIVANDTVELDLPGLPQDDARAKRLIIARGPARQLVYYWYQSRGRVIAEDWKKIIYVGWDRATSGRTDGSLVRFTVPLIEGDDERAERAFRALAEQLVPLLPPYVPS